MTPLGLDQSLSRLRRETGFRALVEGLDTHPPALRCLAGLTPFAAAAHTLQLRRAAGHRPLLALAASQGDAESLHEALSAWFGLVGETGEAPPLLFPAMDVAPGDGLSPHPDIAQRRATALWHMARGQVAIVVAPVAAAMQRVAQASLYRNLAVRVRVGGAVVLPELERRLVALGYSPSEPVEMVGQFAVRGGIADIFAPGARHPYRFELVGDDVDSIRAFDPRTQRSIRRLESIEVLPMQEFAAGGSGAGLLPPGWEFTATGSQWRSGSLLDLLPGAWVVLHAPEAIERSAGEFWDSLLEGQADQASAPEEYFQTWKELLAHLAGRPRVAFADLGMVPSAFGSPAATIRIPSRPVSRFEGNVALCVQEIKAQVEAGTHVLVASSTARGLEHLADLFHEHVVRYRLVVGDRTGGLSRQLKEKSRLSDRSASVILVRAEIERGCVLPDAGLAVYGTQDLFPAPRAAAVPKPRRAASAAFLTDLEDLREGDRVVHSQHGVGRYVGTRQMVADGRAEDFMLLEYADRARLYLPLTRLDLVHKYHGAGGPQPPLDKLGGQTWEKTKRRVKARLLDMADDLLKLYAKRELGRGYCYSADSSWQREFEEAFPHEPTEDQLAAVADIKRDMESPRIMDRLVCGDVGFGKTEVAMRAAFKALGDDKQVAVLVPTTVLAFQHLETFRARFEPFPIEVRMLSRLRSPRKNRETLAGMRSGTCDIVIGTHRLLSKDVQFRDLGLLIVDEEQRFGVRHKERLKQIRSAVDVLTLTATPIPRTLYMALTGLRDVSVIKTPPQDRLAIQTVVAEYDERMVTGAIAREVQRGGQVYFLHNRVESIQGVADRLAAALPTVRFRVGHGQMGERQIERVMLAFMRHEFDVLVATTIIENGLDIPLANTLVVDQADRYGLAELYQLRGRVGRSNRRAYAYLLVPDNRDLREQARKRLAALREFSELGAGFKLAALDLELRGSGNLLGGQQSGQVAAVGFETFGRLLEEAVRELRGERAEDLVSAKVRLRMDVHIPHDYVGDPTQRLLLYKRLAAVRDADEREQALGDLRDRYGAPPEPVRNLLGQAVVQHKAQAMRIPLLERRNDRLLVRLRPTSKVDPNSLGQLLATTAGASFSPDGTLELKGFDAVGPNPLHRIEQMLETIAA